jgi:hypothetical protein
MYSCRYSCRYRSDLSKNPSDEYLKLDPDPDSAS